MPDKRSQPVFITGQELTISVTYQCKEKKGHPYDHKVYEVINKATKAAMFEVHEQGANNFRINNFVKNADAVFSTLQEALVNKLKSITETVYNATGVVLDALVQLGDDDGQS